MYNYYPGINCPMVSEPGNGTMTVNVTSYYVGGVASYSCLPSHDMIGSSNVTCQATGAWSGPQPMCLGLSFKFRSRVIY